jgi:hypothetical protein
MMTTTDVRFEAYRQLRKVRVYRITGFLSRTRAEQAEWERECDAHIAEIKAFLAEIEAAP